MAKILEGIFRAENRTKIDNHILSNYVKKVGRDNQILIAELKKNGYSSRQIENLLYSEKQA